MELGSERLSKVFEYLLRRTATTIASDALALLEQASVTERNPGARAMLETMIENVYLAGVRQSPVCQSPGYPTVYVRVGTSLDVPDVGPILASAISKVTNEGLFRPSMVNPLTRKNSGNNSGIGVPNIETERSDSLDHLEVVISFKGCGAELRNKARVFTPAEIGPKLEGIKTFVLQTVAEAGGIPCPPVAVGVGIGGQIDVAAKLSRRAVSARDWRDEHPDSAISVLEKGLLRQVNRLGIGPGGVGGDATALTVKVEIAHTHTAICPVVVNFHCWVARRIGARIYPDGRVEVLFSGERGNTECVRI